MSGENLHPAFLKKQVPHAVVQRVGTQRHAKPQALADVWPDRRRGDLGFVFDHAANPYLADRSHAAAFNYLPPTP